MAAPKKAPAPPKTPEQRLELLRKLLMEHTLKRYGEDDLAMLGLYDQSEFQIAHPQTGVPAVLTMEIGDTGWFMALNGCESPEAEEKTTGLLDKLTEKLGFDWDLGAEEQEDGFNLVHFWYSKVG